MFVTFRRSWCQFVVVLAALPLLAACATKLDPQTAAKREAELQKWNSQVHEVCLDNPTVRSIGFYYYPVDRVTFDPIQLPNLEPHFMKNVAAGLRERFEDPEVDRALEGPVNDAVNAQLDQINSGLYNSIYLRVKKTMFIAIVPHDRDTDKMMLFIPEHRGKAIGKAVAGALLGYSEENNDDISVISSSGDTLEERMRSRPRWAVVHPANLNYVFAIPKGKGNPCRD